MVATVVLVSCSSDDNPFPKMSDDLSIIYASTSSATRASINATPDASGNYDVVWDEGDHILIVDKDGNQKEYQLIEGEGTTNGKFKECDKSKTLTDGAFTAYYPVSSYDTTNKTFKWTVGSEKFSQSIGFTGVPMKATPTEPIKNRQVPNFTFSNEAGIFKINIKANADVAEAEVRIGKITVKVNDADYASIAYDNPGFLTNEGDTYYIMMPYQTILAGKCKFQIEDHKGRPFCMATSKGEIKIEQSKINSTDIEIAAENPGYLCFHEYSNLAPCTVQLVPIDEDEDGGWKTAAGKVRKSSQPKTAASNPRELEYSYNLIKWYDYTGDPVEYDKLEHVFFRRKLTEGVATEFNTSTDKMRFEVVAGEGYTPMGAAMKACTRVFGNVMSLIDGTCESVKIPNDYCFASLFCDNEDIREVAYLRLPATTLTKACYKNMFKNTGIKDVRGHSSYEPKMSTPIVAAPQDGILPESCYEGMFKIEKDNSNQYIVQEWLEDAQFEGLDKVTEIGKSSCKSMFEGRTYFTNPILYSAVKKVGENGCERMYYDCDVIISDDDDLQKVTTATTLSKECYKEMFYGCYLEKAPDLPATTLAESCYEKMFKYCSFLTTLPQIAATTTAEKCCAEMFYRCNDLKVIPSTFTLKSKTLSKNCYYSMFADCSALASVPTELIQAETLAEGCCQSMFWNCTSLTVAPSLPVKTLAKACYEQMFYGCKKLATAPALPAENLASNCYHSMFKNCTSLTMGTALPATNLDNVAGCYTSMFEGCYKLEKLAADPYNVLPATYVNTQCYMNMFKGCYTGWTDNSKTGLTTAPSISATNIGTQGCEGMFSGCKLLKEAPTLSEVISLGSENSYNNCKEMFLNCTGLTTAPPVLKAEVLRDSCYMSMFKGCTSLVNGPKLKATDIDVKYCYRTMFSGCTSLKSITVHFPNWIKKGNYPTYYWLNGVASSGTIYAKLEYVETLRNSSFQNDVSFCPAGWTVQPI